LSFIHEIAPDKRLQPFVKSYWWARFPSTGYEAPYTVVPNGYTEWILHLGSDSCRIQQHSQVTQTGRSVLIGLQREIYRVSFQTEVPVFAIRFHPEGLGRLMQLPASALVDQHVDAEAAGELSKQLARILQMANNVVERVRLANEYLLTRYCRLPQEPNLPALAMSQIRLHATDLRACFQNLNQIPLSRRQLQRKFREEFGISMQDYWRIARLNQIHAYMRGKKQNLTQLSYELNFSDQSHFIREFRSWMDISPKQFLREREKYLGVVSSKL
jgi:hypothetical protein